MMCLFLARIVTVGKTAENPFPQSNWKDLELPLLVSFTNSASRMRQCLLVYLFLLHFTRFCLSHPLFHFGQKFGGVFSEIFSPAGSSKCHNCNDQRDKGNDEIQNGHNACSFLLKYRAKAQIRQSLLLAHEFNGNSLVAWYASASVAVTGSVTLI
jgi:hypothetical protein